jgi:hypothetical protein
MHNTSMALKRALAPLHKSSQNTNVRELLDAMVGDLSVSDKSELQNDSKKCVGNTAITQEEAVDVHVASEKQVEYPSPDTLDFQPIKANQPAGDSASPDSIGGIQQTDHIDNEPDTNTPDLSREYNAPSTEKLQQTHTSSVSIDQKYYTKTKSQLDERTRKVRHVHII